MKPLTQWIDHTLLKPETTSHEIARLCEEAKRFAFFAVCVNPVWVKPAKLALKNSDVKVATVVGFPLGANLTDTKCFETHEVIRSGADEIDMVINIGKIKSGDWNFVEEDIHRVVEAAGDRLVKVILETCLLTREEKIRACQVSVKAGVKFVKTSTGFSTAGATLEDVRLMRETVGPSIGVKASGGLKTKIDFEKMIEAGATRLGTSSAAQIFQGLAASGGY
jgi:deoxyribose-phosphate aldolase